MKKKILALGLAGCSLSAISVIVASLAWFQTGVNISVNDGMGYTESQYFESGNGSENNPYIISNSNHLYNLAWLQYIGNFNNASNTVYHFKLKNDVDMTGYVLPPIGTTAKPFIGVFDGQDHVISNLSVSNSLNDMPTRPHVISSISDVSIVGFFGVVGDPDTTGLVGEDTFDFSSITTGKTVSNFYLENITVKSNTSRTLIGVVAGYADANIHDIGVKNASLEVINNATGLVSYGEVLSKYSLVGDTTDIEWKKAYSNKFGSGDGGSGSGSEGFGGSMDMWDTNRRVTYIMSKDFDSSNSTATYYKTKNSSSGTYGAHFRMIYTTPLCVNSNGVIGLNQTTPTSIGISYLLAGCLPINVNTETMFGDSSNETYQTITTKTSSTTRSWPTVSNTYYNSHTSEEISDNNTGYFVADKAIGSSNATNQSLVFGSKTKAIIAESYTSIGGDLKISSCKPSNGTFEIIKDVANQSSSVQSTAKEPSYFGFLNYDDVISKFKPTLDNAITRGFINGFRLSTSTLSASSFSQSSNSFLVSNVKLDGQNIPSYRFVHKGLNFTVKRNGRITLVLTGSQAKSDNANSNFRLFKVNRSDATTISELTEISKVYLNNQSGEITYNNSSSSDDVLFYDFSNWNSTLSIGHLYYCEIPVTAGDYYIAGPTSSNSGYLVYLDIGDRGNSSGSGGSQTSGYDLKNIRYVHVIPQVTADGDTYMDILFRISTTAAVGDSKIYFKRISNDLLYYSQQNSSSEITMEITIFVTEDDTVAQENDSAVWN